MMARIAKPTRCLTVRACASPKGLPSRRGSAWSSGTRTPPRSSPKSAVRSASKTSPTARPFARKPTKRPVYPTAWLSTSAQRARSKSARPWALPTTPAPTGSRPAAAMPVTSCRSGPFFPSAMVTRSSRAISSPVSRPKAPRPATSPVVCRALPNCSKLVVRRTAPSSPKWMAVLNSAATTRTSAASRSRRKARAKRSSS